MSPSGKRARLGSDRILNLGPKSSDMLREIGVNDGADLERIGAVMAYRILKDRFPGVSLNMLYGLEAALTGRTWLDLTPEEKQRLRDEADALKWDRGSSSA